MATGQFVKCNKLNRKAIMQIYELACNFTEMCDSVLSFYFVRNPETNLIGDGILVGQIWPLVSSVDDEKFNTKSHTKVTYTTYFLFNIFILL